MEVAPWTGCRKIVFFRAPEGYESAKQSYCVDCGGLEGG